MASESPFEDDANFRKKFDDILETSLGAIKADSPLKGMTMATRVLIEAFEEEGFSRAECLYLAECVMNGTPGSPPVS